MKHSIFQDFDKEFVELAKRIPEELVWGVIRENFSDVEEEHRTENNEPPGYGWVSDTHMMHLSLSDPPPWFVYWVYEYAIFEMDSGWIQTADRQIINIFKPEEAPEISIEALATSMARVARFGGHTKSTMHIYDVALHSVGACNVLKRWGHPPITCMMGLLHDASEAILGDIQRPLKSSMSMRGYRLLEAKWEKKFYEDFIGRVPTDEEKEIIKEADNEMLRFEAMHFLDHGWETLRWWRNNLGIDFDPALDSQMSFFSPCGEEMSRRAFLIMYNTLKAEGFDKNYQTE